MLTASGRDLVPALLALAVWGTRHLPRRGTPAFTHAGCGAAVETRLVCDEGHSVEDSDVVATA